MEFESLVDERLLSFPHDEPSETDAREFFTPSFAPLTIMWNCVAYEEALQWLLW
jgi:hypothetical protein